MRNWTIPVVAVACAASLLDLSLPASTLRRLSLNDMIQKSTMIVRGNILPGSSAAFRGTLIYTHYKLAVTTAFKGTPGATIDLAVPGGVLNGTQQPVAGAPIPMPGQDCVFFLWTSKTGLTQVIGLSQGLFNVTVNPLGQTIISRGASSEVMLNSSGQIVSDTNIQMPLSQLVTLIQASLVGGAGQ